MPVSTPPSNDYTSALLELARLDRTDLADALRAVTEIDSRALHVERAGVWLFSEDRAAVRCVELFRRGPRVHESGPEVRVDQAPAYFRALEQQRVLEAHDVQHDPRTRELTPSYLKPLGITSMLDVPIWREGRMVGILCHEHVGPRRTWSREEQDFARAAADAVALAMEANDRRRADAEREALLRELTSERELLEQVLQQMPAGVIIVNEAGRVILQNDRASDLLRTSVPPVMHEWDPSAARDAGGAQVTRLPIARSLTDGESITDEELSVDVPDGEPIWLSVNSGPVRDHEGRIIAAVAAFLDITQRRRNAEALLEEAEFRERFMGILGHDLRSPAAAIQMSAQLLQRTHGLSPHQHMLVSRIVSVSERMQRMISELLDLTRIRSGRLALRCDAWELDQLVADILAEIGTTHPGRRVELDAAGDLRGTWDGDRLAQLITNLVTNALTHGDPHGRVRVRLRPRPDAQDEVSIEVHNDGPPIPDEVQAHLFDPFHTTTRSPTSRQEGLGLGLYIGHAIVTAHGGSMVVDSAPGRGTTFTVHLPRGCAETG